MLSNIMGYLEQKPIVRLSAIAFFGFVAFAFLAMIYWNNTKSDNQAHFVIGGGGFIFNYREAQITYGLTASLRKPVPKYTTISVELENPAGGAPFRFEDEIVVGRTRYSYRTPPLVGVEKDRPYDAIITVRRRNGDIIESHQRSYSTTVDPSVVPDAPLTIGPGYHRNPAVAN